jgi:hypothetical protein
VRATELEADEILEEIEELEERSGGTQFRCYKL